MSSTDEIRGVWTRKQRPLPRPSPTPDLATEDVSFEIDHVSVQEILSDLMPPQEEAKTGRATLGGGVASPKAPVAVRRASLFGGAIRVKAPTETAKRTAMMTPGRMVAKARVPLSASKTPKVRSSGVSHLPDSTILDFAECPDFLLVATQAGLVGGKQLATVLPHLQTPSKTNSSSAYSRTPGKQLSMKQCLEKMEKENTRAVNITTTTPGKTPGKPLAFRSHPAPSAAPTSAIDSNTTLLENTASKAKPKSSVEIIKPPALVPVLSLLAPSSPVKEPTLAQIAPRLFADDHCKQLPPIERTSSAVGRLTITKVPPAPLDPNSLPFPPSPQAPRPSQQARLVTEPHSDVEKPLPAVPLQVASSTSTTQHASPPSNSSSSGQSLAVSSSSSLLSSISSSSSPSSLFSSSILPSTHVSPTVAPTNTTDVASHRDESALAQEADQKRKIENAQEFGNRLRSIAVERQALLKMLQRLQDEETKLISNYLVQSGLKVADTPIFK